MSKELEKLMREAIEQAKHSRSKPNDPFVGAILAKGTSKLEESFRGELDSEKHAEHCLLEKFFRNPRAQNLTGLTLYTTLEPCTFRGIDSQKRKKDSCTDHILKSKCISKVIIGMLDPNPFILGHGILLLRQNGIAVELFPHELMLQIETLNIGFLNQFGWYRGEKLNAEIYPDLDRLLGTWIVEASVNEVQVRDYVYIQRRVGSRLFGIMINQQTGIEYNFFLTYEDKNVLTYIVTSKSHSHDQRDHGTGIVLFKNNNEADGFGVTRGVVTGGEPILVPFRFFRAS